MIHGLMIFKGTKAECEKKEAEILEYNQPVNMELRQNINKEPSNAKSAKQNEQNREICRVEQLEQVLTVTKNKLEESEEQVHNLELKLQTATTKILDLQNEANKCKPESSIIDQLLNLSVSILSSFGSKEILDSISYPDNESGPKQVNFL